MKLDSISMIRKMHRKDALRGYKIISSRKLKISKFFYIPLLYTDGCIIYSLYTKDGIHKIVEDSAFGVSLIFKNSMGISCFYEDWLNDTFSIEIYWKGMKGKLYATDLYSYMKAHYSSKIMIKGVQSARR